MEFFNSAIDVLKVLVMALGAGQHRESAGLWPDMYLWTMLMCGKVTQ